MTDRTDVWYRIGYSLASLRAKGSGKVPEVAPVPRATPAATPENPFDSLVSAMVTTVAGRAVAGLTRDSDSSITRVVRAGLAGAAGTLVLRLVRTRLLHAGDPAVDPTTEVLAGAARGILYGSVVDPWLPGPGFAKGAVFGALEYSISPLGGLDRILGAASPHRTIPMLAAMMDTDDLTADTLLEHVVFGATVGLLYGSTASRNGTVEDV